MRALLYLFFSLQLVAGYACAREFTFAAYNVENYAPLPESEGERPRKSAQATEALHDVIASLDADILGLCEMGGPTQFNEFKRRLNEKNGGYIDFEYVEGSDPERHLALASRYPIVARHSQPHPTLRSDFSHEKIRRGLLDVTIAITPEVHIRLIGVHLKSKLAGMEDAEFIRRVEARLLRKHIDTIFAADPHVRLIVYGDFNDSKASPALREVVGRQRGKTALFPLRLVDSEGDSWTHYWKAHDAYTRIDFILVSRILGQRVNRSACYLYRAPDWAEASDHRPLFATFNTL